MLKKLILLTALLWVSAVPVKASGMLDVKSFLEYYYGAIGSRGSIPADAVSDGKINSLDFGAGILTPVNSLRIRVSKSEVIPGESYTLFAVVDPKTNTLYSGNLEIQGTICDANNSNCVAVSGPWKNFDGSTILINGAFTVTIPVGTAPGVYNIRYRPLPNPANLDWSNNVQINIGTTSSLEDTRNYFIYWSGAKTFSGHNFVYGEDFATQIAFEAPVTVCGAGSVRPMTFIKNNVYGYWNPAVPWYNDLWAGTPNYQKDLNLFDGRFKADLRWYLVDWSRKTGWQDTWLTAYGHKMYQYLTTPALSTWTSSYLYGSQDPTIPNYFLAPEWVGAGWGEATNKSLVGKAPAPTEMCNVTLPTTTGVWTVHGDFLNLTTSKGTFPALRLRQYEGDTTYLAGGNFLREDWWFIKNQGLVRIDVKDFGSTPIDGRSSCTEDYDCLYNDVMLTPHVSLTRTDYL